MYVCTYVCMCQCRFSPPMNFETFFEVKTFSLQLLYDNNDDLQGRTDNNNSSNSNTTANNNNNAAAATHKSSGIKKNKR